MTWAIPPAKPDNGNGHSNGNGNGGDRIQLWGMRIPITSRGVMVCLAVFGPTVAAIGGMWLSVRDFKRDLGDIQRDHARTAKQVETLVEREKHWDRDRGDIWNKISDTTKLVNANAEVVATQRESIAAARALIDTLDNRTARIYERFGQIIELKRIEAALQPVDERQ